MTTVRLPSIISLGLLFMLEPNTESEYHGGGLANREDKYGRNPDSYGRSAESGAYARSEAIRRQPAPLHSPATAPLFFQRQRLCRKRRLRDSMRNMFDCLRLSRLPDVPESSPPPLCQLP
ncbi:hypothetical protein C8J56DRAFT_913111 [Mycena floridula]|nr:hypothetical protein C8J56DRAFT_913111 [Mycena floridula]